jgi:hypothetical protein
MTHAIQAEGLVKRFGKTTALAGVDLVARTGRPSRSRTWRAPSSPIRIVILIVQTLPAAPIPGSARACAALR